MLSIGQGRSIMDRKLTILVVFIFLVMAPGTLLHAKQNGDGVKLIIGMPADGMAGRHDRDLWFGGLMEQLIHFRLGADESIQLVSAPTIHRKVGERVRQGKVVPLTEYLAIASRQNATHVLQQNYEIARDQRSIHYYAEIIDIADPDNLTSFERDIPVTHIAAYADSAALWIYRIIGKSRPEALERFYTIAPIIPESKVQKEIGRIAVGDQWLSGAGAKDAASAMMHTLDKEPRNLLVQYLAAQSYEAGGAYDKAAEILKDIVAILPNYKPMYVDVCRNFRLSGNYEEAISYAAAAEGKGVHSIALLVEGGKTLEAMGKYHKARRAFGSVAKIDKNQVDALLFFARDANREGKREQAIDYARKALNVDKHNGYAYLELGNAWLALDKLDDASSALAKSSELLEDNAGVYRLLGDIYRQTSKHAQAAAEYEKALALQSDDLQLHLRLAESWEQAGNKKQALAVYRRAEEQFPAHMDLQKAIGMLSYETGDYAEALQRLEQFTGKGRMDAQALMVMGKIYTDQKQYDRAFYAYNHAMPLLENKNQCRFAMASLYVRKGDHTAAVQYLQDILATQPDYPEAQRLLADAWYGGGNYRDALKHYEKARKLENDDAHIQSRIAYLSYELGDFDKAEEEYGRLLSLEKNDAVVYYRLAVIALKKKRVAEAEKLLTKAQRLGPPSAQIDFALGDGFEKAEIPRKAAIHYEACIAQKPDNLEAMTRLGAVREALGEKKAAAEVYARLFELDNDRYADRYVKAGLLFEGANEVARAREVYNDFLEKGFTSVEVNLHLARLEYRFHVYAKVIKLLTEVQQEVRQSVEFMLMLADSYVKSEKTPHAIEWLELAYAKDRTNTKTIDMLASVYEQTGKLAQARIKYEELFDKVDETRKPDLAYHIGELYLQEQNYQDAVSQFTGNIRQYPNDLRNYDKAIALYREKQNTAAARRVLEQAVSLPESDDRFVKGLADVCLAQNDRAAAIRYYKQYLQSNTNDFSAWYNLGTVYADKQVHPKASDAFEKAVALEPHNLDAQIALGLALMSQNRHEEAAAAFARAHGIDGRNTQALELLVSAYRKLGNEARRITALEKLAALMKENFAVRQELGTLLLKNGATEQGIAVLEQASKLRPDNIEVHLALAGAYEKQQNENAWYSHLKSALSVDDNNAQTQFEIGRFYQAAGKEGRAQKHFAKAVVLDKSHGAAHYALGMILFNSGEMQHAFDLLKRAAQLREYEKEYITAFARVANRLGKSRAALESVEKAVNIDSAYVPALSLAGMLYKDNGEYERARRVLMRAISRDQNCAECYRALGDVWLAEEQIAKAAGFYRRALEIAGYHEKTMMSLGRILALTCQDAKAIAVFEEVLGHNRDHNEAFYRLSHLSIRNGDAERAQKLLNERRKESKTVWHQLATGELKEIEGDRQAAKISYTVALRLMPESPQAFAGLGRINLHKKEFSEAVENFGKALARDPYNPYLLLDMGRAYEGIGQQQSAHDIYFEIADKYPQVSEAYYRMAVLVSSQKKHNKAVEILREGMAHNPNSARLHMALGNEYAMLGKYEEAIEAYEVAFRTGGRRFVDAFLHIANIYSKNLNDEKEAKKWYKKYLKAGGKDEQAKREMAQLERNT